MILLVSDFKSTQALLYLLLTTIASTFTLASATESNATQSNVMIMILPDDVGTGDVPGFLNTSLVDMPNYKI